ncbi:hypothetical protein QN362_14040 [Actimicrobium sp. CCC2.4]|uniref:hypothetical protein n=1 Tax=Actimicrobium sp. CCC2.4 TaxID=3048606 RepID=UPI002AC975D6|nr:hypothetical protein [Actimicrobium sp. CCC2.4]MEB0136457.1 hypothetical protein [Actimicrobium sp. CCC2.4]WPX30817.1 hypothetical protein RHM62_11130 [Actimicrobium sp. CCC2.4]
MAIVFNLTSQTSSPTIQTTIGDVSVPHLNDWNNTSFSQLCLGKSESELLMLSKSGDLSADKRAIAGHLFEQNFQEKKSAQV